MRPLLQRRPSSLIRLLTLCLQGVAGLGRSTSDDATQAKSLTVAARLFRSEQFASHADVAAARGLGDAISEAMASVERWSSGISLEERGRGPGGSPRQLGEVVEESGLAPGGAATATMVKNLAQAPRPGRGGVPVEIANDGQRWQTYGTGDKAPHADDADVGRITSTEITKASQDPQGDDVVDSDDATMETDDGVNTPRAGVAGDGGRDVGDGDDGPVETAAGGETRQTDDAGDSGSGAGDGDDPPAETADGDKMPPADHSGGRGGAAPKIMKKDAASQAGDVGEVESTPTDNRQRDSAPQAEDVGGDSGWPTDQQTGDKPPQADAAGDGGGEPTEIANQFGTRHYDVDGGGAPAIADDAAPSSKSSSNSAKHKAVAAHARNHTKPPAAIAHVGNTSKANRALVPLLTSVVCFAAAFGYATYRGDRSKAEPEVALEGEAPDPAVSAPEAHPSAAITAAPVAASIAAPAVASIAATTAAPTASPMVKAPTERELWAIVKIQAAFRAMRVQGHLKTPCRKGTKRIPLPNQKIVMVLEVKEIRGLPSVNMFGGIDPMVEARAAIGKDPKLFPDGAVYEPCEHMVATQAGSGQNHVFNETLELKGLASKEDHFLQFVIIDWNITQNSYIGFFTIPVQNALMGLSYDPSSKGTLPKTPQRIDKWVSLRDEKHGALTCSLHVNLSYIELHRHTITVQRCTRLPVMDTDGKIDAFVEIRVLREDPRKGRFLPQPNPALTIRTFRTPVVEDNLDPEWNSTFNVELHGHPFWYVQFILFDDTKNDADGGQGTGPSEPKVIGQVVMALSELLEPLPLSVGGNKVQRRMKFIKFPFQPSPPAGFKKSAIFLETSYDLLYAA